MNVRRREIHFKRIILFVSIACGIFGIVLGAQHIYAAVLPSSLPDALKKKVGIGKEISLSGWAWNGAMGWVSQRGAVAAPGDGTYGIIKNTTEGVTGWSWSPNYGWICWGKTCLDDSLTEVKYGKNKPSVGVPAISPEPDVFIEPVQTFPIYGDEKVEGTEQCDHGNANGTIGDSCDSNGRGIVPTTPVTAFCGNGIKESGETCDDGDSIGVNACNITCNGNGDGIPNLCGNGIKESGETCDDGDRNNANACKNDCTSGGLTVRQDAYDLQVKGWIKIIGLKDDGWISLRGKVECSNNCVDEGEEYGVIYDPDHKEFRGWAWSSNLGWIVFSGRTLYDTAYKYAKLSKTVSEQETFKMYDVLPGATSGTGEVRVTKTDGNIQVYTIEGPGIGGGYSIKTVVEYDSDLSNPKVLNDSTFWEWRDVMVYDNTHCPNGCEANYYNIQTGKSTWKTQLLSPWIQTAGGNVFSRKGFGGSAVAFRPSSQYLLYSGGVTLEKDLREGEEFELACCTNDTVIVTKIGLSQTIPSTVYADLSGGNEIAIIKQQGKIKKKVASSVSNVNNDLDVAFSSLQEGEERRLKKNASGGVGIRVVYPAYVSIEKNKTNMATGDSIVVTRGSDGKLKKDGQDFLDTDPLKNALSSEERIVGAMTSWTTECEDPAKKCSPVGRKKDGSDDIVKADALKRDSRPDITFPQKQKNIRRNTLGSLDIDKLIQPPAISGKKNVYGYKVVSIDNEQGILDGITAGLNNTVFVKNGDLSIGGSDANLRGELIFKNGTENGSGTIIVYGGDLHVYRPLRYEPGIVSNAKRLASVAWIVLEKDGKGGNIVFDSCITSTPMTIKVNDLSITQSVVSAAGIFFAEEMIATGKGDGNECSFSDGDVPLYVDGMFIARRFNFQRVYSGDPDLNVASEFIQDTGRAVANTPPGLLDILKSLPAW